MSESPTATTADLSAAIEVLRTYLGQKSKQYDDFIISSYSGITYGHLRAIAAALDGIHIPGHVEKDWAEITDTPAEHWCVARYQAGRMFATERHYFVPAVTS